MLKRPIALALCGLLTLGPASPGLAQSLNLPEIGNPSSLYVSGDQERRLGTAMMQQLRRQDALIEDPLLGEYLASVAQKIALHADSGHPYTFFLVDSPAINAFAAPGGYIGINSGLLLATQAESELAGVLAHEIAHVSQNHIARSIANAQRMSLPLAAALLASLALAAASGNSEFGQAALAGTIAYGTQRQTDFTRSNEQEADRIGAQLLARSGYDLNGMVSFFRRLERQLGGFGAQVPEFLLTHPLPTSRITDTENRLKDQPTRPVIRDETPYFLAKARLRVLTATNIAQLLRDLETSLATRDYLDETAERYAYALALKQSGRLHEAESQIQRLLKSNRDSLPLRIEAAEIALAKGDQERAWGLFREARKLYGDDFVLAMHYGRALATQGDPQEAVRVLEPQLRRRSQQAELHDLYAQAAQRAGNTAAARAALAEYYYLYGALNEAIQQAELGLRDPTATPYQEARLQARLEELKQESADKDQF